MGERSSRRVTFKGAQGDDLDARLDMPKGRPRGIVLFAHCFTCSKDLFSVSQISKALTTKGFGVFRFDFTGLGHSGGEFGNTDFSSNVEDIVAAAAFLEGEVGPPDLMLGHSLGGTAVIAAADRLPNVQAVSTIGSPFEPEHVQGLLEGHIDEIEEEGEARVNIAGRSFNIKRQFLEDIRSRTIGDTLRVLKRPILLFHSPVDDIVGIDNARKIYQAAKHPKSFISLDKADHLLTNRQDSSYVGSTLAAWAERYLEEADHAEASDESGHKEAVTVSETGEGKFQNEIVAGAHYLIADEPRDVGGDDSGPNPYNFLLASLGSCTSMTLRMYADRKEWDLDQVEVELEHGKIHAKDCEDCESDSGKIDRIVRVLKIRGDLDADQRQRLVEIADKCPVHRTLHRKNEIETRLAEDSAEE